MQNVKRQVQLFEIAIQMYSEKLPDEFIAAAIRIALEFEGGADLMELWAEETDTAEKEEIIADIQDLIDDCNK